ncbi:Crp/Fnr family transcriptional regulator [Prosthecomicrobium sp. N25]|uniref:Crp/Fnr family transcriptional regulator n=1 Tax=Prosthecomicrobium sp. N25 TaxID=3129254 RepID=UPI003077EF2B
MTIRLDHDATLAGSIPLFRGLPDPVVGRLLAHRLPRTYDDGEILFQEGDDAKSFFILLEGTVKILRNRADGSETLLNILGAGDTIGECAYCAGGTYSFSAEAVGRVRVLAIATETVSSCVAEDAGFASVLLRLQQRHLETMMDQLEQMKLLTAAQRVAVFILRLAKGLRGAATVSLPYEKALIAQLLGMNPESFSRALAKLREVGATVDGRDIRIASVERLRGFCRS